MHVTPRSYLTAGIAALGVGAIALAPVQPIPNQVAVAPQRVISNLGVTLASSIDPIAPWVDTFTTAGANIGTLFEFYMEKPFPILQTIGANIGTYFEELSNGNAGLIPEQIWSNVQTFFQAPWSPGETVDFPAPPGSVTIVALGDYVSRAESGGSTGSPYGSYNTLLQLFLGQSFDDECQVDGDCLIAQGAPILNLLATNYTGQVVGLLGPLLAPLVVLTRSFTAIGEFFEAGDVIGAINELINIPANLVNGVLNGAGFLDLTGIVSQILPLPVDKIGIETGGLLTPTPSNGSLINPDDPPTQYSGGTGFDAVTAEVEGLKLNGLGVSWFGAVIGLGQLLGEQMVVTPPAPPTAAAEPAAQVAAALDVAPPALTEPAAEETLPVVVDVPVPVEQSAQGVVEDVAVESAPALIDEAALESAPAVVDIPAVKAPAEIAEDAAPKAAASVGSDDSGDTASRPSDSRRGARDAD